jgi:predicted nuclease with TOPRIM domain
MSNTNPQRKMSRLQLKKLKEAAKYNNKIRVEHKQSISKIEKLERELKYARESNQVKDKYWHNIGVERNTLKERVEELETELYFCNRNKRIGEAVDG